MIDYRLFDLRPIIVAIAGSNGAGKTTFYNSYLASLGLSFVNADLLAAEFSLDPYTAADLAEAWRQDLINEKQSFVFETVFSDPVADKVTFLESAANSGWNVVLCFIGLADANLSQSRVAMRVAKGGHDVPDDKLISRYPRTLANLQAAIERLPNVLVFDNSDLRSPYRHLASFQNSRLEYAGSPIPPWLQGIVP